MSDKSRRPLRLLPRRLESWANGGQLDFPNDQVAVYSDYSWEGRLARANTAGECPLVWGAAHAAGAYGMSTPDYLASVRCAVAGGWGLPSRLLRRPRAVVFFTPDYMDNDPVTYPNPARDALVALREPLLTKGVFAGKVYGVNDRGCFPVGMPPAETSFVTDDVAGVGPVPSIVKSFTPGDAEGGEVLYVSLYDMALPDDMYTGITATSDHVPLTNLMEGESAWLAASAAAHDRARWLAVLADHGDFGDPDNLAAQKANVAAVVAAASGADVEVFYTGTDSVGIPEAYQVIYDKVYLAVASFFNLSL